MFLICFNVLSPSSFENIATKWHPEIKHHCPESPIVLVGMYSRFQSKVRLMCQLDDFLMFVSGTKIDLRDDKETVAELARKGYSPIKREQALKVANKIKAYTYVECSALTQKGLKQVRHSAVSLLNAFVIGLNVRVDILCICCRCLKNVFVPY